MNLNLDTRSNLLSVILLAGIGVLVLASLLAFLVFGRADADSIPPSGASNSLLDDPVAENPELAGISEYMAIVERPVFFADRQLPVLELASDGGETAPEPEPEPELEVDIPDLEATVAGIIIAPDVKLAMVTDNASNETLVLREGMAMTGEKSAWKLAEIRARGVRFETDGGRSEDLEMEVETSALKTGAQPSRRTASNGEQDAGESSSEPADRQEAESAARARAEEIRRRVAERRAQLRAEAERRAREQDNGG
jgi:general secretion pathway protein N